MRYAAFAIAALSLIPPCGCRASAARASAGGGEAVVLPSMAKPIALSDLVCLGVVKEAALTETEGASATRLAVAALRMGIVQVIGMEGQGRIASTDTSLDVVAVAKRPMCRIKEGEHYLFFLRWSDEVGEFVTARDSMGVFASFGVPKGVVKEILADKKAKSTLARVTSDRREGDGLHRLAASYTYVVRLYRFMLAHLAESPLFRARDPRWAELWIASGIERNIELLDPELVKNYFRHSRHWNKDVTKFPEGHLAEAGFAEECSELRKTLLVMAKACPDKEIAQSMRDLAVLFSQ